VGKESRHNYVGMCFVCTRGHCQHGVGQLKPQTSEKQGLPYDLLVLSLAREQDMGSKPEVSAGRSRFYAFFASNPWVGLVSIALNIVGVFLTVFFYLSSTSYPELVYLVNPVRTIVVKQGTTSRLGVMFDGRPLTQDVTASQVVIWNRGRQAIRRAAILQGVTITTEPRVPILEATIRKTSRDVVGFDLDRTRLAEGEVSISWNILEGGMAGWSSSFMPVTSPPKSVAAV
jgi:hypothetical protein